jgi:hypothetical protein
MYGTDAGPRSDAMADPEAALCPSLAPSPGEDCPDYIDVVRCSYTVAICEYRSLKYPYIEEYCCFLQKWRLCGHNKTPCMSDAGADAQAAEQDAAADGGIPEDAEGHGGSGDGGVDAGTPDAAALDANDDAASD